MRLIDADALIDFIDCGHLRTPGESCFTERDIVDMLEARPTVDAVEVVYGYWKSEYLFGKLVQRCSLCGTAFDGSIGFNYCGGCGAKMDRERRNGDARTSL